MIDTMLPAEDPYLELGLDPSASPQEVRQAYLAQVRLAGPDRDPARFKQVRAAYDRLASPAGRFDTDMLRLQPWEPPEASDLEGPAWRTAVLLAARSFSDLDRRRVREDFREVQP